tara:strand:- start:441 stop:1334 length:894 start_codon:yes stop_codon:yes gene_type:complete
MFFVFSVYLAAAIFFLFFCEEKNEPSVNTYYAPVKAPEYIKKVKLSSYVTVRLIILKHSSERIADEESRGIIEAVDFASSKGLDIQDLGDHHVNKNGPTIVWGNKCSLQTLKAFVSEQMKISAEAGDTLVIYTTGHGGSGGGVQNLGRRSDIAKIFAESAEENDQETLWWQSSCYAAAGLPAISSFNEKQQELFSMIASSTAKRATYWHDQTKPMKELFTAMATMGTDIDPDQNSSVSAKELSSFLNRAKKGLGELVYAKNSNEVIFGLNLARMIPIINPDGSVFEAPSDYIPLPNR